MLGKVLAVVLGLFLMSTTAHSQSQLRMGIALECDSKVQNMLDLVQDKYGEQPFVTGQGLVQNITGKWQAAEVMMLVNPESKSFSVIIMDPVSGLACMLLAGQKFGVALRGN